jgi:hypothetical protein
MQKGGRSVGRRVGTQSRERDWKKCRDKGRKKCMEEGRGVE